MKTLLTVFVLAITTALLVGGDKERHINTQSYNVPSEYKKDEIKQLYKKVQKLSDEVDSVTISNVQLIKQIEK